MPDARQMPPAQHSDVLLRRCAADDYMPAKAAYTRAAASHNIELYAALPRAIFILLAYVSRCRSAKSRLIRSWFMLLPQRG